MTGLSVSSVSVHPEAADDGQAGEPGGWCYDPHPAVPPVHGHHRRVQRPHGEYAILA